MDWRCAFGYFGWMTAPAHQNPFFVKPWAIAFSIALASAGIAVAIVYPGMLRGTQLPISIERFGFSDLTDQNMPLRAWGAAEMAHGRLPLWYPGCYGGLPLASIPEAAPYYLPSALFYMMANPGTATAWTIVFHLMIAGVGAAMLARHFGASIAGQALAAVLMSVGLHLPGHVRQLNIMQAEAWIPWAWLFLDRLLMKADRRDIAGLGLSMGLLGLAGHPEILHHTAVVLAFWFVIRIAGLRGQWRAWRFWTGRATMLAAAALIAGAVAMPNLGPICEMMRWTNRAQAQHYSPDIKALGMFFHPMILGDPAKGDTATNPFFEAVAWEQMFYIGLLPIGLAIGFGVFGKSRGGLRVGLFAIGAISLMLGFAPLHDTTAWIAGMIPLESSSRFSHRYLWCFNLVVVILASFGLDGLLNAMGKRFRFFTRRAAAGFFVLVVPLIAALDIASATRRLNPVGDGSDLIRRPHSLDVIEISGASPDRFAERLGIYAHMVVSIKAFDIKTGWNPNPEADREMRLFWEHEHPSLWGWQTVRGYVGMDPWWTGMIMGDQHTTGLMSNVDAKAGPPIEIFKANVERFVEWNGFFGGRWLVSPVVLESSLLFPIADLPGKYFHGYVYENRAWAGPAWISHQLKTFDRDDRICLDMETTRPDRNLVRMRSDEVPAGIKVDAKGTPANDRVENTEWPDPRRVIVNCRLDRPGFLVLNQSFHPGWSASVDDGAARTPLRVNVSQTGIWLNAGEHRIVFEYPGHFEKICIALAICGLIAAAFLLFWRTRIDSEPA